MSTSPAAPSSKPAFPMPAFSPEHLATQNVAQRLVELCAAGKNRDAIVELYADDARHVEAMETPGNPRVLVGKAAILRKADHWEKTTTVHGATVGQPSVNGDQFVCAMTLDCTCAEGPFAGQRMNLRETAVYTVKDGRVTEGKFFYVGC